MPVSILHIVGARPNFMKLAPVHAALAGMGGVRQVVVHTGQHYSANMSDVFFRELSLPEPDLNLGAGSGGHAAQTAAVMTAFEPVLARETPDAVVVYGDVNSTLACSLVCAKAEVPVAHVEAGLRSFDRSMPEEINRMVTDRLARLLLVPSADGEANLRREGVPPEWIVVAGNVMIDTLKRLLPLIDERAQGADLWRGLGISPGQGYVLATLHRPACVDDPANLAAILSALGTLGRELPVVFPVHPRTRANMAAQGLVAPHGVRTIDPVGYVDFLALQRRCTMVITDSGGVQEETTWLGVPCLTARANTERPVTVDMGTNELVGMDMDLLLAHALRILDGRWKQGRVPSLWDGLAGERCARAIVSELGN